jgi:hypothetical protein
MTTRTGPSLETTERELRELSVALRHTRDDLWREIYRKRCDTLLDRLNDLTRS